MIMTAFQSCVQTYSHCLMGGVCYTGVASTPSQKSSTNQQAATSQGSKMSVTAGSKEELFNTPVSFEGTSDHLQS